MRLSFRTYSPADRHDCLGVFSSNLGKYFLETEREEFAAFIDSSGCPYFVIEGSPGIVGCGGYGIREPGSPADLCWGMVASAYHGNRFGEFLLLGRLNEIVQREDVPAVRLTTSQHTAGFFRRYGFTVLSRQREGIAEGLDQVEMRLELTDAVRTRILRRWPVASGDCGRTPD